MIFEISASNYIEWYVAQHIFQKTKFFEKKAEFPPVIFIWKKFFLENLLFSKKNHFLRGILLFLVKRKSFLSKTAACPPTYVKVANCAHQNTTVAHRAQQDTVVAHRTPQKRTSKTSDWWSPDLKKSDWSHVRGQKPVIGWNTTTKKSDWSRVRRQKIAIYLSLETEIIRISSLFFWPSTPFHMMFFWPWHKQIDKLFFS